MGEQCEAVKHHTKGCGERCLNEKTKYVHTEFGFYWLCGHHRKGWGEIKGIYDNERQVIERKQNDR